MDTIANKTLKKLSPGGYLFFLIFVLIITTTACTDSAVTEPVIDTHEDDTHEEIWPEVIGTFSDLAVNSLKTYHDQKRDYKKLLSDSKYDPYGDFLNWGRDKSYNSIPKDPNGIVTSTGESERYNPCTIAQYALSLYGKYLQGEVTKQAFLHQADFLISMIEDDGSVRYYFDYPYYCMPDKYLTIIINGIVTGIIIYLMAFLWLMMES